MEGWRTDFGPGPYAQPLTEVTVGVLGRDLPVVRQRVENPYLPIVITELNDGERLVEEAAFSLVTGHEQSIPSGRVGRVRRLGGLTGTGGWAVPPAGTDPAFRSVAWGTNRPIIYRVSVAPGGRKEVVLGFCEPYKARPGMRLLELHVEGARPITIDPLKDSVRNRPYVYSFHGADTNKDGELAIEVQASPRSPDPNVMLNCFWVFPEGTAIDAPALIRGELPARAEVSYSCGQELERSALFPRLDGIFARSAVRDGTPVVTIRSRRELSFDVKSGILQADGQAFLLTRPAAVRATKTADGTQLELPPGTLEVEVLVAHGPATEKDLRDAPTLRQARGQAEAFWMRTGLPYGTIAVQDDGIQSLVQTSIRTLYQVREITDGMPQFQPGPTVYRGLWAGDAMLTGMPVMMLGDMGSLRGFLEGILRHQGADGRIRSIEPVLSLPETPAVVTALCLYARASGDSIWLKKRWDAVVRGLAWVCAMHGRTLAAKGAPWYGLMPPGFVDGGISGETADYGSVWWALVALEQAAKTAAWLGMEPEPAWGVVYDELVSRFRVTAGRDLRRDAHGNLYLPIAVSDTSVSAPTRGQYALLFPFRWGNFFLSDSAFLRPALASIAMLDGWTKEGLVTNSGWLAGGVWPWLGGVHGMAQTLIGNREKAEELLYAVANHAAPTGVWVEEQQAREFGERVAGDVSDAEAAAVFIGQVRDLIAQERGDTLDLLRGIPAGWVKPGTVAALHGGGSLFGPVTVSLVVGPDGGQADLEVKPVDGRGARGGVLIHLAALIEAGFRNADGSAIPASVSAGWGQALRMTFRRP